MPGSKSIRRSVALPADLVAEVLDAAPPDLRGNLNRLVVVSLQEFVERRKAEAFEHAMAAMAADPAVRTESAFIAEEFAQAEMDGLKKT